MKKILKPVFRTFIFLPIIFILFNGCTIHIGKATLGYSTSGASITPDMKTASVQYFQNRATLVIPSLAQTLTDALKDKILSQTNLKVVNGMGDVDFESSIETYGTSPTSVAGNNTNLAQMARLTIGLRVKYTNSKDPTKSFDTSFSRYKDYDARLSLTDAQNQYQTQMISDLIDDVFNKAFVNW